MLIKSPWTDRPTCLIFPKRTIPHCLPLTRVLRLLGSFFLWSVLCWWPCPTMPSALEVWELLQPWINAVGTVSPQQSIWNHFHYSWLLCGRRCFHPFISLSLKSTHIDLTNIFWSLSMSRTPCHMRRRNPHQRRHPVPLWDLPAQRRDMVVAMHREGHCKSRMPWMLSATSTWGKSVLRSFIIIHLKVDQRLLLVTMRV